MLQAKLVETDQRLSQATEEWQEKDRQQQSDLLCKQQTINKLSERVDSLEHQLLAETDRCSQLELVCVCVCLSGMEGDCVWMWLNPRTWMCTGPRLSQAMEKWKEKDCQQQFALLSKQEAIDKLNKLVNNLEEQLSARTSRYMQWELFHTCITVGEGSGGWGALNGTYSLPWNCIGTACLRLKSLCRVAKWKRLVGGWTPLEGVSTSWAENVLFPLKNKLCSKFHFFSFVASKGGPCVEWKKLSLADLFSSVSVLSSC